MEDPVGMSLYRRLVGRRIYIVTAMAVSLVVLFLVDVALGQLDYSLAEVLQTIFNPDSAPTLMRNIIWGERLPEAVAALLVGAALGIAGAEMQTILDNPLAEPYTLGISMSSAFGASLTIAFGIGSATFGGYASMVCAFVCAMAACAVIYGIARNRRSSRVTIILAGVALLFLFQSLVQLIQSVSSQQQANSITFWMFGSLSRVDWDGLLLILIVLALVSILFALNLWKLTALKLGDAKVSSLGIDVSRLRRNVLVGVSVLTAVVVSFTGTIGFIGLVGPHIARILVGEDQRFFLPASALCGALFLCAAAVVCKMVPIAQALPVGIVTSLIGVPFFFYMIMRSRRASA